MGMRKPPCQLPLKSWTVPPPRLWELRQSRPELPWPPTPTAGVGFSVSHGVCSSYWPYSCFLSLAAGQWSTSRWGPTGGHLFASQPATTCGFHRTTQPPSSLASPPTAPWVSQHSRVILFRNDCKVMVRPLFLIFTEMQCAVLLTLVNIKFCVKT